MFRYLKVKCIVLCTVVFSVSCNKDDDGTKDCMEQLGKTETLINSETLYQARWTLFEYLENGALSVTSFVQDQNCLSTASMGITGEPNLDRQNFTKTQSFREPTNIRFRQIEEDSPIGKWEIVEGEPNWVQFDEITETIVKGRFQATLVIEENGNDFQTLPDTLRFDNVSFEAVPGDLLNGN
ncbi:hypothetical protein FEE95_00040 [Maribacter algarum]|uniref:Uncharacterized protein n=1 Tax=Maribacter algarum (ex Zhang et al. 2020) TaxID=2578118 RepID=A0A5S3PS92_9FLAO|nr:hypothetical protein [Maribacter algarum]TMM57859.1 hypothetical protein FEE95_00040 [Maribacter algarum]